MNYSKQTQSNPTCSELACTELVEPISKQKNPADFVRIIFVRKQAKTAIDVNEQA